MVAENYANNKELFELILSLSKKYSIDRPYVVGGLVRDFLLGYKEGSDDKDIDITTMSLECARLAILFSLNKNEIFRIFEDKHISIFYFNKNIDFSPGFSPSSHPGVIDWVKENAPDKMEFIESFSRDFTVNSMHQDIETGKIFDPTGMGIKDVDSKILRTPISPSITIKNDPRRIFRAIRLSSQLGLSIDSDLAAYVRENSEIILDQKLTVKYITLEINRSFEYNPEKTIANIFDFGLFKIIPLTGAYSQYLIKNKLLQKYLS
jgi:poly(A) polymerase